METPKPPDTAPEITLIGKSVVIKGELSCRKVCDMRSEKDSEVQHGASNDYAFLCGYQNR